MNFPSLKRSLPVLALGLALCAAISLPFASSLSAHGGATGVVKERMDNMKALKEAFGNLTMMMTGKRDYNQEQARAEAMRIEQLTAEIPELFPKGSLEYPSESLPDIWEDWDGFLSVAEKAHGETLGLVDAIASNDRDAVEESWSMVGRGCKTCHRKYKAD